MKSIFALVWRSNAAQEEFESRIPRLMEWLRDLKERNILLGCGGGGWENDMMGGLTLLDVQTPEEAVAISKTHPMNEIGKTEIFLWDVFWANLVENSNEAKLKPAIS